MAPYSEESPLAVGVGAAGAFLDAQTKAKRQRLLDEQERQRQEQQATYEAAQISAMQRNNAKADLDLSEAARIKALRSTLKPPPGKLTPEQEAAYYRRRGDALMAANDEEGARDAYAQANSIALTTDRFANATYTGGAKTDLAKANIWRIRIEAPREFNARIASIEAMNKAKLQAGYQAALTRANASVRAAGIRADAAGAAAQLALQKWVAGTEYSAAVRATVDEYNQGMMTYREERHANDQAALFGTPGAPAPYPNATQPVLNVNVPPPQVIYVVGPDGRPQPMVVSGRNAAGTAPASNGGSSGVGGSNVVRAIVDAKEALRHGLSIADVRAALPKYGLSPQEQAQVLQALQTPPTRSTPSRAPAASPSAPPGVFPQLWPH